MRVRVKRAESARERDAVLRLRHQVFVEEEGYLEPRPDGILLDRFDVLPETDLVIALVGSEVVGTARLTFDGPVGLPTDAFFDRRREFPEARLAAGSMLCVRRQSRTPAVVFALMAMTYYRAVDRGATHLLTAGNPDQRLHFERAGFRALGPREVQPHNRLPFVPMALDLVALGEPFRAFIAKQPVETAFSSFDRVFLTAGETLFERGDSSDDAFLVIDGKLTVRVRQGTRAELTVARAGPGLIAEPRRLPRRVRTATMEAATDCQLMPVTREALDAARANVSLLRRLVDRLGRCSTTLVPITGFAAGA